MVKVFISRPDGNVAWGFRLQGGSEYGLPLILTNIVPNSPADGKVLPGDILIELTGNNTTYMTHKNALELIQLCGNALFLNLHRAEHSDPVQQWTLAGQHPASYDDDDRPSTPVQNVPPPTPPIRDAGITTSLKGHQSINDTPLPISQTMEVSNISARLAKNFSSTGSRKPLLRGTTLPTIYESTHERSHRELRSNSVDCEPNMNRRMIVPPESVKQHGYASCDPIQPFSYATQQPILPRKSIQRDTDVITQTRSFQMLQGWISDSEKTPPSPKVIQSIDQSNKPNRRASSDVVSTLPSRSFRYLQEQYHGDDNNEIPPSTPRKNAALRRSSDIPVPSRIVKYASHQHDLSQQTPVNRSQSIDNRTDLLEIYNKPPASFRAREPEAKRFTGSSNPSRSFRFLQMMTEEDPQNDSTPTDGYTKPQQLLSSRSNNEKQSGTLQTARRIDVLSNHTTSTNTGESEF